MQDPPRQHAPTGPHTRITMASLLDTLGDSPPARAFTAALDAGRRAAASGASGSSTSLLAGAVAARTGRPVVLVVAHLDDADEGADELVSLGLPAFRLPALEVLPGESNVSIELFAERLAAVRRVIDLASQPPGTPAPVVFCPIQALMQMVPPPARLEALQRTITRGQRITMDTLIRWLDAAGYKRLDAVEEPGDFAVRGGILDVFPPGAQDAAGAVSGIPVRLDFFGDEVEKLTEIDLETMGSDRAIPSVDLFAADTASARTDAGCVSFLDLVPARAVAILAEMLEVTEQGRGYFERVSDPAGIVGPPAVFKLLQSRFHAFAEVNQFSAASTGAEVSVEIPARPLPELPSEPAAGIADLASAARSGSRVIVACQNPGELQRFGELIAEFAPGDAARLEPILAYIHRGFVWDQPGDPLLVVPYHELLHRFGTRRRAVRLRAGRAMDTFLEFQPGDYVVHSEHGIARFISLTTMKPKRLRSVTAGGTGVPTGLAPVDPRGREADGGEAQEYLTLEFAGKSRLHVPAVQIDLVQKYVGGFKGKPALSTLGGQKWKSQKERVAESVKDLAAELLRVRAAREHMPGVRFPADTPWQKEFEAAFPHEETDDQLAALVSIKRDQTDEKPMDRLVCGDVGFGKTELAIRAAFKVCEFGKQVAVLVPTTVLAEQHERTFAQRFADYPFRVASLSRFKTDKEINDTLAMVRQGKIDVVIGTHRLLSKDVRFADLGLVVIDEEQRFGVEHKEQLLRFRLTADVLTLSATPIPRTLHMSLLGLRDISSLTTAPLDRQAVVTEVIPWNARRIQQAIARELAREGQIYYVHNRVYNIKSVADTIQQLAPDARIVIGHGQMPPHELEQVMLRFMRRQADILVSTTIIESGIDNPTANTMFIADADRFGLADLHQLRGRVGRYKHRAYCYMLLPDHRTVREIAQRRLKAIEQFSMLGAGFKIAMRDLEIRGAGNLLGAEQSGHIAAVGYEMFCHLLEDSVHELKHERPRRQSSATGVDIGISGSIPKTYILSDARRMDAYRRIAQAASADDLARVKKDLTEAYGDPPRPTLRLLELAQVRLAAAALGVRSISIRERDVVFRTDRPLEVVAALEATSTSRAAGHSGAPSVVALPPKSNEELAEVYFRPPTAYLEPETLLAVLRRRLCGPDAPEPAPPAPPVPPARPAPPSSPARSGGRYSPRDR
jgi:transcription-repair coupling factor (superfamily II helicase)